MSKVYSSSEGDILRTFRFIPYDEIVEVLKKGEDVFLEQDKERPLKRSTMWRAAKKLSKMIGKKVRYDRALFRIDDIDVLEGYSFSIEG
jgi:hypothetical protein